MNFPDGLLPTDWAIAAHFLLAPLLVGLFRATPWTHLRRRPDVLGVFLLFLGGVVFLWTARAGLPQNPGLNLHLLGATVLTLAFGWPLALLGMLLALLAVTGLGLSGWHAFSLNALVMVVVPVAVAAVIHEVVHRKLPNHPFIYIFVSAFLGGALTMAGLALASSGVLLASGTYGFDELVREYLRYIPLLMFPEAFVSGGILAILVVYKPEWVATFDDETYIQGK
ncbi:MAG TPA: energy-coupling factor ABC transporter permease [Gammaproteobacteria bacterium]|nr:energy-coupling factor ABC transporter permease [Gammaproteobacteria bacterium]